MKAFPGMCELLAISSNLPVDVNFSLIRFAKHGGETGPHRDGWGIAYYEGRDVRRIREAEAASGSEWVRFIENHDLRGRIVMSHIRYAMTGERSLSNTQPFTRELGGDVHVFAHNGELPGIFTKDRFRLTRFAPIGATDSEHAFCFLMDQMENIWRIASGVPTLDARMAAVVRFANDLRSLGSANFLYSDGDLVFVHGHRRRTWGPGSDYATGLHILCRQCQGEATDRFSTRGLSVTGAHRSAGIVQDVVLVASVPLTDEAWSPLDEGEVVVISNGTIVERSPAPLPCQLRIDLLKGFCGPCSLYHKGIIERRLPFRISMDRRQ